VSARDRCAAERVDALLYRRLTTLRDGQPLTSMLGGRLLWNIHELLQVLRVLQYHMQHVVDQLARSQPCSTAVRYSVVE
jgi:hypothetical protein